MFVSGPLLPLSWAGKGGSVAPSVGALFAAAGAAPARQPVSMPRAAHAPPAAAPPPPAPGVAQLPPVSPVVVAPPAPPVSAPVSAPVEWFYKDPSGAVQGPFKGDQMRAWHKQVPASAVVFVSRFLFSCVLPFLD